MTLTIFYSVQTNSITYVLTCICLPKVTCMYISFISSTSLVLKEMLEIGNMWLRKGYFWNLILFLNVLKRSDIWLRPVYIYIRICVDITFEKSNIMFLILYNSFRNVGFAMYYIYIQITYTVPS
jgi:hypothetical protein